MNVKKMMSDLHFTSADSFMIFKDRAFSFLAGALLIIGLPYLHLGVFYSKFWVPNKTAVNRNTCSCNCFDTIFKGSYETAGSTRYKHIYFNTTEASLKIWIITTFFMLMTYEGVKYLVPLLRHRQVHWGMFILCLVNIFPLYYSYWSFFNFYNDGFFNFYYHQLFFMVTEFASACMVLHMCSVANEISSKKILFVVAVSTAHVFLSGLDQFVAHVFLGQGRNYQLARDFGLMAPDLLHIVIPLGSLHRNNRRPRLTRKELVIFILFVGVLVFVGKVIMREFSCMWFVSFRLIFSRHQHTLSQQVFLKM